MNPDRPIRSAFRAVGQTPALALAEIAWRGAFRFAALTLVFFAAWFYFDSLPVTPADRLLLATGLPALVARAFAHIFAGSGAKLLRGAAVLLPSCAVLWTLAASAGRAAALKTLLPQSEVKWRALVSLNFVRVMINLAACVGILGGSLLYARVAYPAAPHLPRPVAGSIVFFLVMAALSIAWWLMSNLLAGAAVFATGGRHTGEVFSAALASFHACTGSWFGISSIFGLMHFVLFAVWFGVLPTVMSVAALIRYGWVTAVALAATLAVYFGAVDALYATRQVAYVALSKRPPSGA